MLSRAADVSTDLLMLSVINFRYVSFIQKVRVKEKVIHFNLPIRELAPAPSFSRPFGISAGGLVLSFTLIN